MSKKPITSSYFQASQGRFSRHQNRKIKTNSQQKDHKQLIEYIDKSEGQPLQGIYEVERETMPEHYKLGIWRKNMGLLSRNHLPTYTKILDFQANQACLIPSRANINPKKNSKSQYLIQDPHTSKTRSIKIDTFPILFTPQEIVFYQLSYAQFEEMFDFPQFPKQQVKRIYNILTEENENLSNTGNIFWPAVIMEGLNYKFDEIQKILSNFMVNKNENFMLFQKLVQTVSEISQNSESKQDQKFQIPKKIEFEELQNRNSPEIEDEEERGTQNKFCIWLIGTAQFKFTNKNIVNWQSYLQEHIKNWYLGSIGSNLVKQSNLIIDSLNKLKRLREAELKADEYKSFIYRLGVYKDGEKGENPCIPLRFQYVKGAGKRILIKILGNQSTQLRWVPTQTTTVNYSLPIITKKQMNFMYLVKKLPPFEIIRRYFYREFLYLPQKNLSEIFEAFFPRFFVSQQEAYHQRCKSCNYVIRDMAFKYCFFCHVFSHEECAIEVRQKTSNFFFEEVFSEYTEMPWICQKCQACTVCSEEVGDDYLFCSMCFSYSHFECGRIKGLQQNQPKMKHLKINDKYVCEFCLKCKMCGHKLKDNQYLLMENEFYCGECSDKIKSNNHCHVCMKKKEGNSSMKWIQCGSPQCLKWVHEICDPEYISVVKSPTVADPYLCPFCRQIQMRKVYAEIIDCISVFDQAQFFTQPSYLDIPLYNTIISEPMCFMVMKQKALQGKYDENAYKKIQADFQLIISNALKFNMPKDTAHVQAKILKILGERALIKFQPLFKPDLTALISGGTFQQIKKLKLQLHREINSHYLQILLNYRAQKSFIQVRENKRKPNEFKLEDELKFRSSQILNNLFKNSSLIFHLKKQKIKIENLFTMPKNQNQRGVWHSIKGDLCYYHNSNNIIYTCNECCESYCCLKECIRHRICTLCAQKECKCDSYECGCPPLKEKQKKTIEKLILKYSEPMKTYKEILMDLTENFKYCLKCAQEKIGTRICQVCEGLCSWGYFRCPDCMKIWHKKCYPHLLNVPYIPNHPTPNSKTQASALAQSTQSNLLATPITTFPIGPKANAAANTLQPTSTCSIIYCNDCLSSNHPNTYQQILNLSAKSKLVKISKITHYMRIFIQIYFNQGIRLTPYQIQHLILENYDQFSIRESLFKQYQLNHSIIQRFRNINFRTNAAIERSFAQYVNDYVQVKRSYILSEDHNQFSQHNYQWADKYEFIKRCKNIWWKYCKLSNPNGFGLEENYELSDAYPQMYCKEVQNWKQRFYLETIAQLREKILLEAYTYKDFNTYKYQRYVNTQNILELLQPQAFQILNFPKHTNQSMIPQWQSTLSFDSIKSYKNYLQSLNYIHTIQESYYKNEHRYRYSLIYYPRPMPFDYKLIPTFKKKNNLQEATREFLLGIYEQSKFCLRKGTTCIIKFSNGNKDTKDYWSVLKRWAKGTKQMQITLQKKIGMWFLKIDNKPEKIVHQIEEIYNEINKYYPNGKITSFKELGEFMGFTIYEPFYKANHFTNFLQTNLVDQMPLLDRMHKITELYESFNWGENGIFTKSGPALTTNLPGDSAFVEKTINYEYSINNSKPQYLTKKSKRNVDKFPKKLDKKMNSSMGNEMQASQSFGSQNQLDTGRRAPFITFEDLKRYLIDFSIPNPIKSQISIKNNPIVNEVFIAPSKIHKLGLFSRKFIKKNTIIIEYIGQIVSQSVADLREKKFHYGCYLFSILKQNHKENQDKKDIIDATFRGNMARYLNHSCDPNCKARTEYVNGSPRIIIYTIRDIQQFQQITYDYQFNVDAVQKLECTCGAKNCQGRLN